MAIKVNLALIRKLCTEAGITLNKLEIQAGLSNGAIARWNIHYPRAHSLKAVADRLGVKIDELLCEVKDDDS